MPEYDDYPMVREYLLRELLAIDEFGEEMKTPYQKGRDYEDASAKQYGKRQPFSGARADAKEDILGKGIYKDFLFQCKNAAGNKSYSIKTKDLHDLRRNSSYIGKTGVMLINFGGSGEYVVIRKEDFDGFVRASIESDSPDAQGV